MITPEKAEISLRVLMEAQAELAGMLLLDFKQQMVLSSLMSPEVDVLRFAGLVYQAYQVREKMFALLKSPAEHTLFWGEQSAIVVYASKQQPLLLAGIVNLPSQVGVILAEFKQLIEAFEAE
jgi:hypothetical protein